jgi:hypothetical protein
MKGETEMYKFMPNIPIDTLFLLEVKCVPKSLSPAMNGGDKRTYYMQQPFPMEFYFLEFIISPTCYQESYNVIYSATLSDGKPLPDYIIPDFEKRTF